MLFVGTSIIHPSTEGVFLLCNILDLLIYSLEIIKLQDLKYITELPDLSGLTKLKKIVLDGTSIKIDAIDEPYKSMVERYWI